MAKLRQIAIAVDADTAAAKTTAKADAWPRQT
jgi:hypothetical protein